MAKDSVYCKEAADYAVAFIQALRHTSGIWDGRPFELIDWQEQIIRDVFGVLKPNGYRQFNTAYIEIPKKNGKSELAAAVALLLTCGDGEKRAKVYSCASDKNQAKIVFDVAMAMVRKSPALTKRVKITESTKTLVYMPNHVFAQIIICGKCGEVFRRVHWNNRGKKSIVWRCVSRLENTGLFCDARTVLESTIEQVLVTAINQTLCDKDSFLTTLRDNIATVINRESNKALADIDKRLEELQTELLKLATSNADYEKVGDEIHRLRDKKQKLQVENVNRDELKKRIADMSTFLKKQSTALTEYDEHLVRRLIEKVTVYEDKFTVEFKSGVTVNVTE